MGKGTGGRRREMEARGSNASRKEKISSLRNLPRLMSLVWETHRGYTIAMFALRILRSLVPVAALWVGKLIIDEIVRIADGRNSSTDDLWYYVGLEIGIVVLSDLIGRASSLVESLLGDLFSNLTSVRMMEHSARLDLQQFEDPEFYDMMERARRQTVNRIALVTQVLAIMQSSITLISLATALLVYSPWLSLLLVATVLPNYFGETHFAGLAYSLLFRWTPERRRLDYYRYLGASDETARELKTYGLSGWITDRYRTLSDRYYNENKRLSIRKGIVSSALAIVSTLGYYMAYILIIGDAITGQISIGTMTFLAGAFARSRETISAILGDASRIQEGSLYLRDLFNFFAVEPTIVSPTEPIAVPRPIVEGFRFEDVGFRYPGSERWAVRNVTLSIRAGERIALVGENGAGKTTITKLLARLYDPTEGRITLDGKDLRDYDIDELRASIGVIFQDFVRYDLSFQENIGVGDITTMSDYLDDSDAAANEAIKGRKKGSKIPPDESTIPTKMSDAAEDSLAASLLPRFPEGWRQMLGKRFDGGMNLSGGEWQKVALARAYLRDAQVLILDEPTAALDARGEYEVFLRFSELVSDRTAVIISHRFSTVRMADRIVVLHGGTVAEDGTHDQLLKANGLYAELFTLQAQGYL